MDGLKLQERKIYSDQEDSGKGGKIDAKQSNKDGNRQTQTDE